MKWSQTNSTCIEHMNSSWLIKAFEEFMMIEKLMYHRFHIPYSLREYHTICFNHVTLVFMTIKMIFLLYQTENTTYLYLYLMCWANTIDIIYPSGLIDE